MSFKESEKRKTEGEENTDMNTSKSKAVTNSHEKLLLKRGFLFPFNYPSAVKPGVFALLSHGLTMAYSIS